MVRPSNSAGSRTMARAGVVARRSVGAILLLLAAATTAPAEQRSAADASTVVKQWLRLDADPFSVGLGNGTDKAVALRKPGGDVFAYAVYLKPSGFVIVSADDEVEPIIAFSPGSKFVLSADNPLGALVLTDLAGRVEQARRYRTTVSGKTRGRQPRAAAAALKWNHLSNRLPLLDTPTAKSDTITLFGLGSITDVRVPSFVMSRWDQSTEGTACYNYYTPNNYVCGCVATAMAQWMRYYQRPTFGVGTASFTISIDGVPTSRNLRGGNGLGGPYDWANMPLDPDSGSSDAQRRAIGALCHDAGVAARMAYASHASGATLGNAMAAMTNVFGYSGGRYGGYGTGADISGTLLNTMMNPNLDAKMPAMLGILRDSTYGHAVLCDGYGYSSGTLYHHLNMGWQGYCDAWYALPTVDSSPGYNSVYGCLYNMFTNGTGEIVSGRITNSAGVAIHGAVVTANDGYGQSGSGTSDTNGIYAIVNLPSSTHYTLTAAAEGFSFASQTADTGLSIDQSAECGNVWGRNFCGTRTNVVANPYAFSALNVDMYSLDLAWARNASNDSVLIAWKTNGTFGAPSGSYAAGDLVAGGGNVLYAGSGTNCSHTGLAPSQLYAYRAWSFDAATNYSQGTSITARTSSDIANPQAFWSSARSLSSVTLCWTNNTSKDAVMVAWKTNGTFGIPSGQYAPGSAIDGGGTVLYTGTNMTSFTHTGLLANTAYDYEAWSADSAARYSQGTAVSARTCFVFYVNDSSTADDVWCAAVGNDANSGISTSAPKATVQAILDAYDLDGGDSIFVDTGYYSLQSNLTIGSSDEGAATAAMTIRGSPNGTVLAQSSGASGTSCLLIDHADFVSLLDLSVTGAYNSVVFSNANNCTVRNLTVVGAMNHGVHVSASSANRFDGFRISHCKDTGLSVADSSVQNLFAHGTVWNNNSCGMENKGGSSNTILNCTFALNTNAQVFVCENGTVVAMTNTIVYASGTNNHGVYWHAGAYEGNYNNLYAANGANVGHASGNPMATLSDWQTATLQDANSTGSDPLFVSLAAGDLHLQSTAGSYHGGSWTSDAADSPGIDAGWPLSSWIHEPAPNGGCVNIGACGNTPQASKSVDSDNDGVSDWFEITLSHSDPNKADSDDDGVSDGNERMAGTDMNDPTSFFAVTEVKQPETARNEVRWCSVTNRCYTIERATNLVDGFAAVTNNIPATPPVNVYTDNVSGLGAVFFYRVTTQP